jgi:RNA-directed DNA polymerase
VVGKALYGRITWLRTERREGRDERGDLFRGVTRGRSLTRIIADLNPILRGWFAYFKHAPSGTFRLLDGFIRRRLRSLLRQQQKRPGFGRCHTDYRRRPNAFFAEQGLFTLFEAHVLACQSR